MCDGLMQCALVTELNGEQATGAGYCLAHHLLQSDEGRSLILTSIRYEDEYVKRAGGWFFAERTLIIDWMDSRPSRP